MIEKKIDYNGRCIFWSLSDGTPLTSIEKGFEELGLSALLPKMTNDSGALRRALATHYPGTRTLIRPISGEKGYAVVYEQDNKEEREMQYEEAFRVSFGSGDCLLFSGHSAREWEIRESYRVERSRLPAASLGKLLVGAAQRLSGIPLRPRGGFYWIPNTQTAAWEKLSEIIQEANSGNRIYSIQTVANEKTLEAVCDALTAEVEKRLTTVEDLLETGGMGKRALNSRQREAGQLDTLVVEYERILGKNLESLRDRAQDAEAAAALAIFSL